MLSSRLKAEWTKYEKERPAGITYWPEKEDDLRQYEACISGPEGSPYAGGTFHLKISIPDGYPMEPPHVTFTTPIYHPNIDNEGRICLEILKMPPAGSWRPLLSVSQVLMHIQVLMGDPNPSDPLMVDIAKEFTSDRQTFEAKAKAHTAQHAVGRKRAAAEDQWDIGTQAKQKKTCAP